MYSTPRNSTPTLLACPTLTTYCHPDRRVAPFATRSGGTAATSSPTPRHSNCLPTPRLPTPSTPTYCPSGPDKCSCTSNQLFPRFSQIPVYRISASTLFPSLVFSLKCIGTVVHATVPRRVTFKSFPAVNDALAALSKIFFCTPT